MTVCHLLIGDGRDSYHRVSRASLKDKVPEPDFVVEIDDREHRLGFTGAVIKGWKKVLTTGADWVLHHELDFTYNEPVDVQRMIAVLERQPHLSQMSLLRQAVNEEEKAAGGIIPAHPEDYVEVTDQGDTWIETQRFIFTTNPSIYSTALIARGWPNERESEGKFGAYLRRDRPEVRCGIWGALNDPPRVQHIGDERTGGGY